MSDRVIRKCDACKEDFETWAGSLLRLCDDPGCKTARSAHHGELRTQAKAEQRRMATLLREPGAREVRPEMIEMLELVARMEVPTAQDVLVGIRRFKNAQGHLALRASLIHLGAMCIRWAAALPKRKSVLLRKGTVDEDERVAA